MKHSNRAVIPPVLQVHVYHGLFPITTDTFSCVVIKEITTCSRPTQEVKRAHFNMLVHGLVSGS
jgi:hypothetical protein